MLEVIYVILKEKRAYIKRPVNYKFSHGYLNINCNLI